MTGEDSARQLVSDLASRLTMLASVNNRSTAGVYIALTRSEAIYVADNTKPDRPPTIIRYPKNGPLLHDATPLPGVDSFSFDAASGLGHIFWSKDDPSHYDRPDQPYVGTCRSTSRVLLVARGNVAPDESPALVAQWLRELLDVVSTPAFDYASLARSVISDDPERLENWILARRVGRFDGAVHR